MNSFIESYYNILYKSSIFFAVLVGLLLLKKYKNDRAAKYFIYFLVYILGMEILAAYPRLMHSYKSLYWLRDLVKDTIFAKFFWYYSIFWTIATSAFFGFYFYLVLQTLKLKRFVKYLSIISVTLCVILFFVNLNVLNENFIIELDIINTLTILFFVSAYFLELLYSEKILYFYKSLTFYISIAVFLFSVIISPLTFFQIYHIQLDPILNRNIFLFTIMFTYLTFALGLIVSKPEKTDNTTTNVIVNK